MMTVMDLTLHFQSHTPTFFHYHIIVYMIYCIYIMNKGLKIVFWNVRSLYNKIDTVRLEVDNIKPYILNINETWFHDSIDDGFVSIKDYTLIRSDRTTMEAGVVKKGGGLCTYVKSGLVCEDIRDMIISNKDIELHLVKYNLPFTRPIFIFNVYWPPSGDLDIFINTLKQ